MRLKILIIIFISVTMMQANVKINTKMDRKNASKGIAYLTKQMKNKVMTTKLKRYFLAKIVKKPFIFLSNKPIYNLYLTSILNRGRPVWLDDDKFVFHTSSGQRYLKRLQKVYKKKYNLETIIYKNPKYKTKTLQLKDVDTHSIVKYIREQISASLIRKKKEKKSTRRKKEKTIAQIKSVNVAQVITRKDVKHAQKGIKLLEIQKKNETDTVKLKRYFLAKTARKPFIFSSNKPIYNLYLTSILNGGRPVWLDDDKFVFHTSSSKTYLKRLQKLYKKKYNLKTIIYKNPNYKKKFLPLKDVDTHSIVEYIQDSIPVSLVQSISKNKQALQRKKARNKRAKKERESNEKKRLLKESKEAKKKEAIEKKRKETTQKKLLAKEKKKSLAKQKKEQDATSKRKLAEEKIWAEKKRKLEDQRKRFEKQKRILAEQEQARKKKKLAQEKEATERKRRLAEEKSLAEKKRKLEAERKKFEKQKRILAEQEQARKKKKLALKKQEAERLKKLAQKKAQLAKREKERKKDTLTSDLDQMMKETSDFKKKLERFESIKYY